MAAEVFSFAQVLGVELLRVPDSPAADFQDSPANVLPFPSELDPKEYRQFTLPTGETLPLSGLKALYMQALISTSRENPLLDSDARNALRKPGEDITPKKLQRRLLQTRWQLNEWFQAYGIRYAVAECFHEVSPSQLQRAHYLRPFERIEPDEMKELADPATHLTNETDHGVPPAIPETPTVPSPPKTPSIQAQLRGLIEEGKYTYLQITALLYPGIPLATAKNRLSPQLNRLRGTLLNEGLFIPDGRKNLGGVVTVKKIGEEDALQTPEQVKEKSVMEHAVENENTPITPPTTTDNPDTVPQEAEDFSDEDEPAQIINRAQKRAEAKTSPKSKLTITQNPDFPGKVEARIEIPGKGKTPGLQLSRDEALLFETIFTSPQSYTHPDLELKMVDIARSAVFDSRGGFERVFNSLNKKLTKWHINISFNDKEQLVLSNATDNPLTLTPVFRDYESDFEERLQGQERQRRRQPSHGKLRL